MFSLSYRKWISYYLEIYSDKGVIIWKAIRTVCITYTRNNSLLVGKRTIVWFPSVFFYVYFFSFLFRFYVCVCVCGKGKLGMCPWLKGRVGIFVLHILLAIL